MSVSGQSTIGTQILVAPLGPDQDIMPADNQFTPVGALAKGLPPAQSVDVGDLKPINEGWGQALTGSPLQQLLQKLNRRTVQKVAGWHSYDETQLDIYWKVDDYNRYAFNTGTKYAFRFMIPEPGKVQSNRGTFRAMVTKVSPDDGENAMMISVTIAAEWIYEWEPAAS